MKPLKKLALIPILAAIGFAAAQMTVPAAYGEDPVRVSASVLFNFNGGAGYVSFGEPFYERVVEPPVVYVYREHPRPVIIHEHARPVVIVKKEYRDCDRPGRGHAYGHYKKAPDVVVIERNERVYRGDRCDRADVRYDRGERYVRGNDRFVRGAEERFVRPGNDRFVRGGERYVQQDERYVPGNTRVVRYEAGGNHNNRGHAKQVVESRKGKNHNNR